VDHRQGASWHGIGWAGVGIPAALLALGTIELASLGTEGWVPSIGLEAVAAVALVVRRTHPFIAALIATVALGVIPLTGTAMDDPAAPILFYVLGVFSLGRRMELRGGLAGLAVVFGLMAAQAIGIDPRDQDLTDVVFVLALGLPPFFFGRIVRRLHEQGRELEAQQEVIREQAVRAERDRIARELHDVIAHSVSAMVVQTAAAQELLRTRPERAAELLESVAETGRAALAETGRLLHVVRDEADELGLRPAPGLADVPELVRSFRDAGTEVEAELVLPEHGAPGSIDVSAYRVVQEALTNAMRYASGPVRLQVDTIADELRIRCTNGVADNVNGRPRGSGLGLQGMAERVSVLGGTMSSGPVDDGFTLEVRLPLGADA
jgi:signal transduction histidine kinase